MNEEEQVQRIVKKQEVSKVRGASINGLKNEVKLKESKYQAKIGVNPFPRMKRMASITRKTEFQKAV